LDGSGAQVVPAIELQKMPTPRLVANGSDFINISWSPLNDTNDLIAGFTVYRSVTNGTVGGDIDWKIIGGSLNNPISDLYFNDTTPMVGMTYYYSLRVSFLGYESDNIAIIDNDETLYFGEGSAPFTTKPFPPMIDYIEITDSPNGSVLLNESVIVGSQRSGICSAYNNTAGFLGTVIADWTVSGGTATLQNPSPSEANGIDVQMTPGPVWLNASLNGFVDSVLYTVLAPEVDYIQIRDSPNGLGEVVSEKTYSEGETDTFWAAGYNHTSAYIGDMGATWVSNDTVVGDVLTGPNGSTTFTAGVKGGTCHVTAIFGSITNVTQDLEVLDINTPPKAMASYHIQSGSVKGNLSFPIDITLRISGTKQNSVKMELFENETMVTDVRVTKDSDDPDSGNLVYDINSQNTYEVRLTYEENTPGENPGMVTYDFLGNVYSQPVLFKTQTGLNQTAHMDFNDIQKAVGVVFFDGIDSFDVEGDPLEYVWDLGDGTSGTEEVFVHTYKENGEYPASLTVTDLNGATNKTMFTVNINDIEKTDWAGSTIKQPAIREFLDSGNLYSAVLQCPADLVITDPDDGQIGQDAKNRINSIEGAFVTHLYSDIEVYLIPEREFYIFEIYGLKTGIYNLSAIDIDNNVARKYSITNSSCRNGSLDRIVIYFTDWELSIDTEEDLKIYSLEFLKSSDSESNDFTLSDMNLTKSATHTYIIKNWEELDSERPVTLAIDEDSDGEAEKKVELRSGIAGTDVDALLLRSPVSEPAFPLALFIMVGFIAAIGIGGLLTEIGKWGLLSLIIPLYSKIKKEEILNHPVRHKIHGYIIGNPGAHFGLIKQDLSLGNGQVVYHLKRLVEVKLVYCKQDGIRKRFYPKDFPKSETNGYYLSETEEKILEQIEGDSGITQKKIASGCGVSRQVAQYHLLKMEEVGVIRKVSAGRETKYYPSDGHKAS
jgi:predicted transcriptional regulator